MAEIMIELREGPASEGYASVILGERGTGKTAMLNALSEILAEDGWVVLRLDASTPGLLGRVVAAVEWVVRESGHVGLDELKNETMARMTSLKAFGVGASWEAGKGRRESVFYGVREHLTVLTQAAADAGCSVLLAVDELHNIDRDEARRLFNDYQQVSSNEGLPLAFLGAGLSWMENTIFKDKKITFLQRCRRRDLEELSILDAMRGIREPVLQSGGNIGDEALGEAAEAAAGRFPYKLQLVGHNAWRVAGAPKNQIGSWEVSVAIQEANRAFARNVSAPAWSDLSDGDRAYMSTLASLGGNATRKAIGEAAKSGIGQAHKSEERLAAGGYVIAGRNSVKLGELVPLQTVSEYASSAEAYGGVNDDLMERCANWMPRARANCVLAPGHSGRCRSRL
ncbi:MAG: ATP-binding protein [Acidimicrobiia bacterium]|nr:ATP-binding protein [Acidimicrobiia bacterium]